MKKKIVIVSSVIAMIFCVIIFYKSFVGTNPFKGLTINEVESVMMHCIPDNKEVELSKEEQQKAADLLQDVVIYNRTFRHEFYGGTPYSYTIIKRDGTKMEVVFSDQFIIIHGKAYRTKSEYWDEVNTFESELGDKYFY